MDFLLLILFLFCMAKLIAAGNALVWLRDHGTTYRVQLSNNKPQNAEGFFKLFESHSGNFFPLGFKDYKLRRFIDSRAEHQKIQRCFFSFIQKWLFRFQRLVVISCFFIVLSTSFHSSQERMFLIKTAPLDFFLVLFPFLILVANVLSSLESIYSYAILGSYAESFHMLHLPEFSSTSLPVRVREIWVFFEKFVISVIAAATVCYVIQVKHGAFSGETLVRFEAIDPFSWFWLFFQMVYFAATTMLTVGYGDIIPATVLGQFAAFIIMCQGFLLIVIVFSSLISSAGDERLFYLSSGYPLGDEPTATEDDSSQTQDKVQ